MKKLIIASLFLAGVSFAGNAQTGNVAVANHSTSPAIGKHPAKVAGKTNTIAAKNMTATTGKTTAATTEKKSSIKKTPVKTNSAVRKTVINHKKHKAHKKLAKRRTPAKKMQVKKK